MCDLHFQVSSWSKMTALAPVIMFAFHSARGKKVKAVRSKNIHLTVLKKKKKSK